MNYPIAEVFESPQGEGSHAGTLMTFVRFAGCNVGKPYTPDARQALGLNVYQERCTSWDGQSFSCDTNYRKHTTLNEWGIVKVCETAHVCLTGGEPFLHDLSPVVNALIMAGKQVHIETSGTKPIPPDGVWICVWVCVSPKLGCLKENLDRADEIKILVGPEFDAARFLDEFSPWFKKVWLQPINAECELDMENVQRCMDLQHRFKDLRISVQLHKVLRCR